MYSIYCRLIRSHTCDVDCRISVLNPQIVVGLLVIIMCFSKGLREVSKFKLVLLFYLDQVLLNVTISAL